jgi:hypothetical protein
MPHLSHASGILVAELAGFVQIQVADMLTSGGR